MPQGCRRKEKQGNRSAENTVKGKLTWLVICWCLDEGLECVLTSCSKEGRDSSEVKSGKIYSATTGIELHFKTVLDRVKRRCETGSSPRFQQRSKETPTRAARCSFLAGCSCPGYLLATLSKVKVTKTTASCRQQDARARGSFRCISSIRPTAQRGNKFAPFHKVARQRSAANRSIGSNRIVRSRPASTFLWCFELLLSDEFTAQCGAQQA